METRPGGRSFGRPGPQINRQRLTRFESRGEDTISQLHAVSRSGWPGRAAVMWSRERAAALLAALARANDRFLVGSEADAEAVRGDAMRRDATI